jgi:serine/threonine-protein kinase
MSSHALSHTSEEATSEFAPVSTAALVAGKYKLFASLGRGGMADVFLGVARGPAGFNKVVVLKKLRENRVDNPAFVDMFLDEARLAARINHPNVVHTYEIGEGNDGYFISMEYLEGQSLHSVIKATRERGERLEPAFAAHVMAEVLNGLHHAHEMRDYDGTQLGIVHRDVSPHNLFITYDGQIKVLDFGIAKAALNNAHTQDGVVKGKFAYMAPEQATSDEIDRRCDVFAAGIVLWELLSGEKLFKGDSAKVLFQLMSAPVVPPSTVNPSIPKELDAIAMKALERAPEMRFQSAREMANALSDYVHRAGRVIRREDVTQRLDSLFSEARAATQQRLKSYMAAVTSGDDSQVAFRGSAASLDLSRSPSMSGERPIAAMDAIPSAPVTPTPPAPKMKKTLLFAGVGALGLLLAGGAAAMMLRHPASQAVAEPNGKPAAVAAPGGTAVAAAGEADETFHLTLSSDPLEAQVEWGGKPVGQTPMMIDLLPGPQTFVLVKEGYFNATIVLNVTDAMAGRTAPRTVMLVPRKANTKPPPPETIEVGPTVAHVRTPAAAVGRAVVGDRPSAAAPAAAPVQNPTPAAAEPSPAPSPIAAAASPPPAAAAVAAAPPPTAAAPAPQAAAATPSTPTVLPFGPEMTRPTMLSGSDPVFTREAIVAGVEGMMIAKCTITTAGTLQNCRIVKGLPYMDQAMLDALATRKYTPVMLQGKPVAVEYVFNVRLAKRQ